MATENKRGVQPLSSNITALFLTNAGRTQAEALKDLYPDINITRYKAEAFEGVWNSSGAIMFVMAAGIAVRAIAPYVRDKATDPAVVVMDDAGNNIISLLSGHEGGANDIARKIAAHTGAHAAITTATDNAGLTSIDVFAKDNGLIIEQRDLLPSVSGRHLKNSTLKVFSDEEIAMPTDYTRVASPEEADVIISPKIYDSNALFIRPRSLVLGLGINTGTPKEEIAHEVNAFLTDNAYSPLGIKKIATHVKKLSEPGLREYAHEMGLPLIGMTTEELNSVEGTEESPAAMKALGVRAVAEPACMLASGDELLVKKSKYKNLTLALSMQKPKGSLLIVGTGPGGLDYMAPRALWALRTCDAVVGYKTYLGQIESLIKDKEVIASGMTQEVDRARAALAEAQKGKSVCVISGGDPGVYAMAGLVFEVLRSANEGGMDLEVIPGISALNACASRLGAPLMHDFATISLSDRLTPWELIEKRLGAAAGADMVIVLYNPKSKGRTTHIDRAREIIMAHRAPDTPVGIVRGATREGEDVAMTTLEHMLSFTIDMQSTVLIGNSKTFQWRGHMVTPRGYADKYEL